MLEPFALGKLIGQLVQIADQYIGDPDAGSTPALKAVRDAGTNWLELLGPLEDEAALDAALNSNIVAGVTFSEFTIAQLALRYVVHLMPYELIWAVLYRHGALKGGLPLLGVLPKHFLDTHLFMQDHNRKVARAAMGANGCQIAGCPIGVDPDVFEWNRRSTFVSLVLGSVA